jgi:DNA-binding transcriptional ArsR family regulator
MTDLVLHAERLKALAHPQRLAILKILAAPGTCICGELVGELPIAQATVSQHISWHAASSAHPATSSGST